MGKTIMGVAAVSLDGFIADDNDDVGPLFDWLGSGDVGWSLPGSDDEARTSRASADFMTSHYANTAANVIGRRLFDLTNGWDGKPAAYEHVFVVTHQPPTDWEHLAPPRSPSSTGSGRRSPPPRCSPATGTSPWRAARSGAKRFSSG